MYIYCCAHRIKNIIYEGTHKIQNKELKICSKFAQNLLKIKKVFCIFWFCIMYAYRRYLIFHFFFFPSIVVTQPLPLCTWPDSIIGSSKSAPLCWRTKTCLRTISKWDALWHSLVTYHSTMLPSTSSSLCM